jgi:hypothetical protein
MITVTDNGQLTVKSGQGTRSTKDGADPIEAAALLVHDGKEALW